MPGKWHRQCYYITNTYPTSAPLIHSTCVRNFPTQETPRVESLTKIKVGELLNIVKKNSNLPGETLRVESLTKVKAEK
jgi:hypothetical protein